MYKTQTSSNLFSELLNHYPPILNLEEGAKLLRFPTVNAVRIAESRNRLPVRLREIGGRKAFFLSDVAEFLETGIPQQQLNQSQPATEAKRRGRPTKASQITRRNAAANTIHSDEAGIVASRGGK